MSVVTDFIAAEIAKLQKIVPTPVAPFGFGTDLSCSTDLTETMDEVDPFSAVGIGEATIRRLTTPRGELPDDPDYGFDLRGLLNKGITVEDLQAMQGRVRQEVLKDDRILSVDVTLTFANGVLTVSLKIETADPNVGTFSFTFAIPPGSGAIVVQGLA